MQCHRGNFAKLTVYYDSARDFVCIVSDIPELGDLFNEEIITNGEYFNDENFEEATFTPSAKLRRLRLKLPKTTER